MELQAEAEMKIAKDVRDVYEAIVDPAKMSGYFISRGTNRLDSGKSVVWHWDDVGAELAIQVLSVRAPESVCFRWSASGVETQVDISLKADGDGTQVKVIERGWPKDDQGIARYGQQTHGWANMLACLKASVAYGINLRV